jgi:hypothetical protein
MWALLTIFSTPGGRLFFSPETLEARGQTERLLWFTHVPVLRSNFTVSRWELVDYLIDQGYWSVDGTRAATWLLVTQWNEGWGYRPAPFVLQFAAPGSTANWISWTERHPTIAPIFWPLVLKILRSGQPSDITLEQVDCMLVYTRDIKFDEKNAMIQALYKRDGLRGCQPLRKSKDAVYTVPTQTREAMIRAVHGPSPRSGLRPGVYARQCGGRAIPH